MIKGISFWASQIIIAVMISVIFEMILPDSKNKKYVKTVIGLYILYTIVSPIISNSSIDLIPEIDIQNSVTIQSTQKKNNISGNSLKEAYILSLKQDIHEKLRNKGYVVSTIKVDADITEENYGKIKSLQIGICKDVSKKKENSEKKVEIEKINIGNSKNDVSGVKLNSDEIEEVRNFVSNEYGVDIDNVNLT